jgi:hypothetical protein
LDLGKNSSARTKSKKQGKISADEPRKTTTSVTIMNATNVKIGAILFIFILLAVDCLAK